MAIRKNMILSVLLNGPVVTRQRLVHKRSKTKSSMHSEFNMLQVLSHDVFRTNCPRTGLASPAGRSTSWDQVFDFSGSGAPDLEYSWERDF